MGLRDWLFGAKPKWQVSEYGNPTTLWKGLRITIFQQDGGWRYAISPEDDSYDPVYSDLFGTIKEAQRAAVRLGRSAADAKVSTRR